MMSKEKRRRLEKCTNSQGIISALAMDQRTSLFRMMEGVTDRKIEDRDIVDFKTLVAKNLAPYASAILLDPIYGMEASQEVGSTCGIIYAYEVSGYDKNDPGRMPKLLPGLSVKELKDRGGDAVKILLYYDVDQSPEINRKKQEFIEKVGEECHREELPFFLEIVTYDSEFQDKNSLEFMQRRPYKVTSAMEIFSQPSFGVDVFKVETPIDLLHVQGYSESDLFTVDEAKKYFLRQSNVSHIPYIFLSGGVPMEQFVDTLRFGKESGADFNGVLSGRATWKKAALIYPKGRKEAENWLKNSGKENILQLKKVVDETSSPWKEREDE